MVKWPEWWHREPEPEPSKFVVEEAKLVFDNPVNEDLRLDDIRLVSWEPHKISAVEMLNMMAEAIKEGRYEIEPTKWVQVPTEA
jgi:hypothetical protein